MLVFRVGIHKMVVRIANREDFDQIRLLLQKQSDLIWVCTVCLGFFGMQLVFKILEHLPYSIDWKVHTVLSHLTLYVFDG